MQKITRIAALLLVALAVVLAFVAFSLGRRAASPTDMSTVGHATPLPNTIGNAAAQSLVVAANALPAGQPISASSLRLDNVPQRPPGSYISVDAVVGDVPLVAIPANTPVTSGLLAHGVAMELRPGERALAVPVDELSGAGNRILPGDYVDVFMSLKESQPSTNGTIKEDLTQTRLLLSRLRVLAYGDQNLPVPAMSANNPSATTDAEKPASKSENPVQPHTAVLAVPVAEVDRLLLGAQYGKLALALRHPSDEGEPNDTLFPQPRTVLSPLASLSMEQQQQLASPENNAYAGIDGGGLAGRTNGTPHASTLHRGAVTQGVEIIRGTQRGDESHATGTHSP